MLAQSRACNEICKNTFISERHRYNGKVLRVLRDPIQRAFMKAYHVFNGVQTKLMETAKDY
jgi:hypothetical protein